MEKRQLYERLDRCLANFDWRVVFPEASLTHLNQLKFEAAWLTHDEFPELIQREWKANESWNQKVGHIKKYLLEWNLNTFGNAFKAKKQLLRRLNGITGKLMQGPNRFLERLQSELWTELESILAREEIIWFQKSRCKWLLMGDRNTRYFHGTIVIRRRRNKVERLLNDQALWVTQQEELEAMVTEPISDEEILQAIKRMGSFKAPGPDGLQAIFYQSQWNVVGPFVCKLIHDIEEQPSKVAHINDTLIVIIAKVEVVTHLKQMRPISLCNVSYKLLTKVLAHRLSKVMEYLVHPNQSSFVPHRNSRDNVIVFQEVMHSMKSKKGNKGWMAIKIDLEKAYDRLNWNFIKDTLLDIGLPSSFINLVWACISSAKFRMLWNGEALSEFLPSRGVRQGDPISPYIFVLCMERLFHLINMTIEHHIWKPICLSRSGPLISHLAFADDLVLFAEASTNQVEVIKACLNTFCDSAGLKVSQEKTRIFFSNNVGHVVRNEISSVFGFQRTNDLGKYLGIPTHHSRVNRVTYQGIIDKINSRLSGWKEKNLSFTGRLTLTKSVLQALPSYTMQMVHLPRALCDEVDKICKRFLWGGWK
uniref:Retrovirus-related Pol polyprotein LINE-1 n=1 Tax=Cajanus cajan TaxID=3821 RepID=A0A151SH12_CAJCA|nr:Retrovirus-related Pol polyprotein LINE-1 [Cajanus cajan]